MLIGAVKITPSHNPKYYDVDLRHKLPFLTIIGNDGLICGDSGGFVGMKRCVKLVFRVSDKEVA